MTRTRILLVGVGGQGILSMGRILGEALRAGGHSVVLGQEHGMSQRGGSVENTLVIGAAEAAFIDPGEADVVVGLEPLETARALPRISKKTSVLMNSATIVPFTLTARGAEHPGPESVLDQVRSVAARVLPVSATRAAEEAGDGRAANVAMLGALCALDWLPLQRELLFAAVDRFGGASRRGVFEVAFTLGFEQARNT
ncbi:MAG: 2-oxoacid:acceptor oxidoreductase family protein [Deltaproteobacteria bacterium]|nr:2-oxoacid:acceptor oxidoreductase family protein [Deltaproteobacteria bacterium]